MSSCLGDCCCESLKFFCLSLDAPMRFCLFDFYQKLFSFDFLCVCPYKVKWENKLITKEEKLKLFNHVFLSRFTHVLWANSLQAPTTLYLLDFFLRLSFRACSTETRNYAITSHTILHTPWQHRLSAAPYRHSNPPRDSPQYQGYWTGWDPSLALI